jgi:hypothetical protein
MVLCSKNYSRKEVVARVNVTNEMFHLVLNCAYCFNLDFSKINMGWFAPSLNWLNRILHFKCCKFLTLIIYFRSVQNCCNKFRFKLWLNFGHGFLFSDFDVTWCISWFDCLVWILSAYLFSCYLLFCHFCSCRCAFMSDDHRNIVITTCLL